MTKSELLALGGLQTRTGTSLRGIAEEALAKAAKVAAKKAPTITNAPRLATWFFVTLTVPPSLNNAYKNVRHGRVLTKQAKDYKTSAKKAIEEAAQFHRFAYPQGARLAMTMTLYFPSNHRRDVSNCVKLPEDALSEVLGFDDSRVDRILVERGEVDKENPRCEITLEILEELND